MASLHPNALRKNTIAGAIGNVLEWYDFAVYGYFAPTLGQAFFPSDDPTASLLAAFGVFAVGYGARPIGGLIFGHIGDRYGRKRSLIVSVLVMGIATFTIGLVPDHAQAGTTAAVLLVALRIIQGLSVGGEFPASVVFLAEHAPPARRGYLASWPEFGSVVGFLLGSAVAALLANLLNQAALVDWGWRIPFLLGAVIAICAVIFRRQMTEPPGLEQLERAQSPLIAALRGYWRDILRIISLILVNSVGFYILFVYATSYLTEHMHVSTAKALDINTLCLAILVPITPAAALLSDRIGRKPLLYFVSLGTLIGAWPLWWLMHHQSFGLILAGQAGFAVLFGVGYAVISATMVETLPPQVRCSAVAIGYNICLGLFGGTAPLVATYLVARTADDFAPAYYLMVTAAISFIVTLRLPEMAGKPMTVQS